MTGRRARGMVVAAAAAAFLAAPAAGAPQDGAKSQAERAEALMDRLYADHGNAGLLREAEGLLDECLRSGNHRTAEYLAGQIVYHRPDRLDDRRRYARILIAKGDRVQAEKDIRDSLRERPSDCASYGLLADLLREDGRTEEALAVHEAHLKEHAGEAGTLYAVAELALWELRDLDRAAAAVRRMREVASAPGAPEATARWLDRNAAALEAIAGRMRLDREAILRAERRVDGWFAASVAVAAAALAGAAWITRRVGVRGSDLGT